jgi:hypothetical protein
MLGERGLEEIFLEEIFLVGKGTDARKAEKPPLLVSLSQDFPWKTAVTSHPKGLQRSREHYAACSESFDVSSHS